MRVFRDSLLKICGSLKTFRTQTALLQLTITGLYPVKWHTNGTQMLIETPNMEFRCLVIIHQGAVEVKKGSAPVSTE